jgi:hypothetical protein
MSDCSEGTRRHFLTLSSGVVSSLVLLANPLAAQARQFSGVSTFSTGTDLGNLIFSLSPYAFQPDPNGKKDLVTIAPDGVEYQEKPGNWYFKGATHNIARSVRIPYTFYWANEQANKKTPPVVEVKDYFLIGFEGGGAY